LTKKLRESLYSVLPITCIVLLLGFSIAPMDLEVLSAFLVGAVMLIVGMGLFTLGAEQAMEPIGERLGADITRSRNLALVLVVSFLIGVVVTVSEPDLQVLATQIPTMPNAVIVYSVALGVGISLMVAMLRILFAIPLSWMLIVCYAAIFVLIQLVPPEFQAIAFDAGGVTTGPMTVPLIMALGLGAASTRSDKKAGDDSFGLISLASVGPIIAVLCLGLVYDTSGTEASGLADVEVANSVELANLFLVSLPEYFEEVGTAFAPVICFFLIYQTIRIRMSGRELLRILIGVVYTYLGLVLFLTGANVGFMPAGVYLGQIIAGLPIVWILVPIGMLIGYFIVKAEPAVHVLTKQVEEITSGFITGKSLRLSLSIGVSVSVGLAMVRVLTGISILWFLVPGYVLALGLSFFVPRIFTAIAFDSGGVASGPMTATFLLPLSMGACEAVGGNVVADAFGMVAMVAMTPLITIQVMGVCYRWKMALASDTPMRDLALVDQEAIIDLL
jgi:hypothetical protein